MLSIFSTLRKVLRSLIDLTLVLSSFFFSYKTLIYLRQVKSRFYTLGIKKEFKEFGKGTSITGNLQLIGGSRISIGKHSHIAKGNVLTAWESYGNQHFQPSIQIGNYCNIGEYNHISAINHIYIGNYVLLGRRITIVDNSHGTTDIDSLRIPPSERTLYSKGPIIIEDAVWIGDKVTILAGVVIGKNSVIAANSVVTHNIPPFSVAAGIPAKVIKFAK